VSPKPKPTAIETAYANLRKDGVPDAAGLATMLAQSIKQLEPQLRGSGPFYPGKRTALESPDRIRNSGRLKGTDDLAAMLWEPTRFKVGRRSELDFFYVDRELVAARSLKSSGKPQITATKLWLDLLLANANPEDRTPIVAEAKLRHDKNPEVALVQALAYAAQLGTARQLSRLADLYPDFFLNRGNVAPPTRLDVYVITHEMPGTRKPALRRAVRLAEGIVSRPEAARHLRRIAFLDASFRGGAMRFRGHAAPAQT